MRDSSCASQRARTSNFMASESLFPIRPPLKFPRKTVLTEVYRLLVQTPSSKNAVPTFAEKVKAFESLLGEGVPAGTLEEIWT